MRVPLWPVHDYATAMSFRDRHVLATRKQETTEAGTSLPMNALRTRTNVEFDAALLWFRSCCDGQAPCLSSQRIGECTGLYQFCLITRNLSKGDGQLLIADNVGGTNVTLRSTPTGSARLPFTLCGICATCDELLSSILPLDGWRMQPKVAGRSQSWPS